MKVKGKINKLVLLGICSILENYINYIYIHIYIFVIINAKIREVSLLFFFLSDLASNSKNLNAT